MIQTTTTYICDRCNNVSCTGDEFYIIKKSLVDTKPNKMSATCFPFVGDGVYHNIYDDYTSYHICQPCSKELTSFFNGVKNI